VCIFYSQYNIVGFFLWQNSWLKIKEIQCGFDEHQRPRMIIKKIEPRTIVSFFLLAFVLAGAALQVFLNDIVREALNPEEFWAEQLEESLCAIEMLRIMVNKNSGELSNLKMEGASPKKIEEMETRHNITNSLLCENIKLRDKAIKKLFEIKKQASNNIAKHQPQTGGQK